MEWISVKDKLPDVDGTLCVVFDPDNETITVWGARWSSEYGNFESMGGWFEADEVTHWMPLPEAPNIPINRQADLGMKELTTLEKFYKFSGNEEPDPLERLRFFCSLAMKGQDWLDVEQFFDDVKTMMQG